jgi:carbamoylphosphate synthase small subunit
MPKRTRISSISVQYPEASLGPQDSTYLFGRLAEMAEASHG